MDGSDPINKISAYFCLLFPNFTYYLQTLTVSIGRRPSSHASSSSTVDAKDLVDIDLGPLSQVSRLHARIEYDEEQERFVLAVLGRNGAWVAGVWYASGRRVPLGARTQITIANQTFHFMLPNTGDSDQDSQSLSSLSDSEGRSPSVDILDMSPTTAPRTLSPNYTMRDDDIKPTRPSKSRVDRKKKKKKVTGKGRGKGSAEKQVPPEDMPPKPAITYVNLLFKAIEAQGGRAALQDICKWIAANYEWYKVNEGSGWESSVRHTLSSHKAFVKVSRKATDKGKGFLWTVSKDYDGTFHSTGDSMESTPCPPVSSSSKKPQNKRPASPTRSTATRETMKMPLPPPLNNAPLPTPATTPVPSTPGAGSCQQPASARTSANQKSSTTSVTAQHGSMVNPAETPKPAAVQEIPSSLIIPIVVKELPADHPAVIASPLPSGPAAKILSRQPIIHDKTANVLILSPVVFGSMTHAQIIEVQNLGARKALDVLRDQYTLFLKERLQNDAAQRKSSKVKVKTKVSKALSSADASKFSDRPVHPAAQSTERDSVRKADGDGTSGAESGPPTKKRKVEANSAS